MFNQCYQKLEKKYSGNCKFMKVDCETKDGLIVAMTYGISTTPSVLLMDNKSGKTLYVMPNCLLDYNCADKVVGNFVKN